MPARKSLGQDGLRVQYNQEPANSAAAWMPTRSKPLAAYSCLAGTFAERLPFAEGSGTSEKDAQEPFQGPDPSFVPQHG